MKKVLMTLLFIVCLLVGVYTGAIAEAGSPDEEMTRAAMLGLVPSGDSNAAITYREFFAILDHVVERIDPNQTAAWQAKLPQARTADAPMLRMNGMMALLVCAQTLGGEYAEFNTDWGPVNDLIDDRVWTELDSMTTDPYLYIPNHMPFQGGGFDHDEYLADWDDFSVAYRYAIGRKSLYSDKTLFACDTAACTMHFTEPMTVHDAVLAALRLYESTEKNVRLLRESGPQTPQEAAVRLVVNGSVHSFTAYQLKDAYYYTQSDLETALGNVDISAAATLTEKDIPYYSLRDVARVHALDLTHDTVLGADYLWTDVLPDDAGPKAEELARVKELGIADVSDADTVITYAQFFAMLDRMVELADADVLPVWQAKYPEARTSTQEMTRFEGMMAILKCAVTLGGDYASFNTDWMALNDTIGEKVWNEIDRIEDPFRYLPNDNPYQSGGFENASYIYDWDDCGVAYRYAFGRISLVSNETLFDYDADANSMRPDQPFTAADAALAVLRFSESTASADSLLPLADPRAVTYDSSIITDALLEKANTLTPLTQDTLPVWKGLVFGWDYNTTNMPVTVSELRNTANWGFNSARVMVTFQTLFDKNVTTVNVAKLQQLDRLVAAAIQYNLHLNLVTFSMPGRWAKNDDVTFTSVGEFDLFTNPKRQQEANAIWAMLAQRYQAIPNAVLSFSPLWEVMNVNLSTGLPTKPYKMKDVAAVYDQLAKTIRTYDQDRIILYEPTPTSDFESILQEAAPTKAKLEGNYTDVRMLSNFCQNPFVYACMTAEEGQHIDNNNHSMFVPDYPLTIYAACSNVRPKSPLEITGELVAGTQIDLYLRAVSGKGVLEITADGVTLYSEKLASKQYNTQYPLSRNYPYAKSDKAISVTLTSDVATLTISYNGKRLEWSGIDVTLPDAYAVERWWIPTAYDAMLNGTETQDPYLKKTSTVMLAPNSEDTGRKIEIHGDVTFTSESIWQQANQEVAEAWAAGLADFAPGSAVRIERANFSGCTQESANRYYGDALSALNAHGLSWFSNDYLDIVCTSTGYFGATVQPYPGCKLNVDLLKMLQQYQ